MKFIKYHHVERFGTDEVEGIEIGDCWIFPKLDGTNASVWFHDGTLFAGSRNRTLSLESDNAGFYQWVLDNSGLFLPFFEKNPNLRLYGEWLVPHTLKTYREDAWRRFWIFDVQDDENVVHLPYEKYAELLDSHNLDHIQPLATVANPSKEQLDRLLIQNTFLIQDGAGPGEGVVVKNYLFKNKYGNQKWAKIVRNEFKEDNKRAFGITNIKGEFQVEAAIAEKYVTKALVDKTRAKIEQETRDRKVIIPRLLETVFHELVTEETWNFVKEFKSPTVDFKKLRSHCIYQTKKHSGDLF